MLLQFAVKNHRSIKDEAVISMKASSDRTMRSCLLSPDDKNFLVPVMAIYGANAAGKSNVLHAFLLMCEMVCGKYSKPLKGMKIPQEPFAFTDAEPEPTEFDVMYYYDGIKYEYGFSFDDKRIIDEYLYHWPKGREALVFSRENGVYEFRENVQEQKVLAGRTPENRLYLTCSNEWNLAQTESAYLWFCHNIRGLLSTEVSNDVTVAAIKKGGEAKERVVKEMMQADLGICDVQLTGFNGDSSVITVHRLEDENGQIKQHALLLSQESMGTQRFFSRIGTWIEALESGAILVVDEIEASMHPLLTRHLIEMFQDQLINTEHAQLIFTTHDTGLLDLTFMRRDQIWFVEKNEKTKQTEVYALSEFSPRKNELVRQGYLQGRYGAIPFIEGGLVAWEE